VGELAEAFEKNNNVPPPSGDLQGMKLRLHLENGWIIDHRFTTPSSLSWRNASGTKQQHWIEENYFAFRVHRGIYLVDFIRHLERATTFSLVLDLEREIFTVVIGQLPASRAAQEGLLDRAISGRELTSVTATFLSGSINRPFDKERIPRHQATDELVGRRVELNYSPTESYEHIYLNKGFFTWHCLAGAEKKEGLGLADTDACRCLKLDGNLYLFVWREKIIPTLGVEAEDFDRMRTCGKIFGYKGNDFGKLSNFPIAAKMRILTQLPRDD
jgi:hypothetical protein